MTAFTPPSADAGIPSWVSLMVKMQARACVISRITGISLADARRIWHAQNKRSSPSGQQPNDLSWFLKTAVRRYHSALLLMLHTQSKSRLPDYAAFAHAYYHYARIAYGELDDATGIDPAFRPTENDYTIPFSRAHYLVTSYTDEVGLVGNRKCPLQLRRCKCCDGVYLADESEVERTCPICSSKKAR